jgi:hypothetical protein
MQLRNGKVVYASKKEQELNTAKKEQVMSEIKNLLFVAEKIPMGDIPGRIRAVRNTFLSVFHNMDFIMSPGFYEPEKAEVFITTVYKKTFSLRDELDGSLMRYIHEHKDVNIRAVNRIADDLVEVLDEVQYAIEKLRPGIKGPLYCDDPECPCDGYL